jgi:hypothetical protein
LGYFNRKVIFMLTRHSAIFPFLTMHLISCTHAPSTLSNVESARLMPISTASSMLLVEDAVSSITFATFVMIFSDGWLKTLHALWVGRKECRKHYGMALHLIKLCVGVSTLDELSQWVAEAATAGKGRHHVTRSFPRRAAEVLDGGSLYWVIKGMIACRQPIAALEPVRGTDGIERCRIVFAPTLIAVRPTPRRAFQGWRYLAAADVPADIMEGSALGDLPEHMQRQLAELGLL